ncbi:MAG: alpha-amylase family glycosyl hydrolase [Bellilinea sp.]
MRRFIMVLILGIFLVGCFPSESSPSSELSQQQSPGPAESQNPEDVPWWKEAVFYEIFVRSFYDSDGDGIGDFNGITLKLDYLNDGDPATRTDLGITAIWLMPIHPSPSYHGYDVINYYGINHDYGTMDEFKNFLSEAHKRGIRVIIDLVLNHTSTQHPFFVDALRGATSDFHDWYIWSPTSQGAGWHSATGGDGELYYYGYFCGCMPDLNYENPDVTDQMEKVAEYWLETVGVDGFRVDAAKHLIEEEKAALNSPATHEWFNDFYLFYKNVNPAAYSVGEVAGSDARTISTYTGDQFDQIFNFEMASGVVNSVKGEATSSIKSAVTFTQNDMPDWNFGTFLTNHDQDRVMSVLGGKVEKAKIAAFILLTSPGTPYIYYGEEIGMQGRKPDELIRRPMQWTAGQFGGFSTSSPWQELDPAYVEVNVQNQFGAADSLLSTYQKLIAIRTSQPALSTGEYLTVDSANTGVYAFIRQKGSTNLLIVVNLTKNRIIDYALNAETLPLTEGVHDVSDIYSGTAGLPLTTQNDGFADYKPLEQLEPYTGYIFELVK